MCKLFLYHWKMMMMAMIWRDLWEWGKQRQQPREKETWRKCNILKYNDKYWHARRFLKKNGCRATVEEMETINKWHFFFFLFGMDSNIPKFIPFRASLGTLHFAYHELPIHRFSSFELPNVSAYASRSHSLSLFLFFMTCGKFMCKRVCGSAMITCFLRMWWIWFLYGYYQVYMRRLFEDLNS